MRLLCLFSLIALSSLASAQPQAPHLLWTKCYGDTDCTYNTCVSETGVESQVFFNGDLLLASMAQIEQPRWSGTILRRLSPNGNIVWEQMYSFHKYGACVTPASDIICVGDTLIDTPGDTIYNPVNWGNVVRLNGQGEILWSHSYAYHEIYRAHDVVPTEDGGCLVAGVWAASLHHHPVGLFLLRLNEQGDTLWTRYYHRGGESCFVSLLRLVSVPNGGWIIAENGSCDSVPQPYGYYVLRVNSQGDSLWSGHYQPPSTNRQDIGEIMDVQPATDGGFLLSGTRAVSQQAIGWLVRIGSRGELTWQRDYGEDVNFDDIVPDSDGFVISANVFDLDDSRYHAYLIRIQRNGDVLWAADGGYARYGSFGGINYAGNVWHSRDGGFLLSAEAHSYPPWFAALFCFSPPEAVHDGWRDVGIPSGLFLNQIYPNPFNSTTTISLTVPLSARRITLTTFNLLGQVVREDRLPASVGQIIYHYDASALASGIYLLRAEAGKFSQTTKLVVMK